MTDMLKGKVTRIIDDPSLPRVKYVCRGEGNTDFICSEERWIYHLRQTVFGGVEGRVIHYKPEEDKIEIMLEY